VAEQQRAAAVLAGFCRQRGIDVSLLLALLLLSLLLPSCSKKEEKEAEAPAPVQVTAVTQDTIRRTVAGDGVLFPKDQANVMAKISAPVQKFYVNRGDHVKEGQLVAVLESRDLTATVAESKGAVDQAESNLRMTQGASVPEAVVKAQTDVDAAKQAADAAKKVLDSRTELFRQGALARRQVDEAQVSYVQANSTYLSDLEHLRALQSVGKQEQIKTAAAQVESAKSHSATTEAQLSYSRIHSPKNGIIADRPLYEGEMASPTTPLLTVMDISRVVARVNVPIGQATMVRTGMPATLTFTDSAEQLEGKVTVVSPASDANSTTVQVWIEAQNPGERLKPGASVHALIVAEAIKAATVVPIAAILPGEEGGTAVLVIDSNSVAHRRAVRLGVREGDKVEVLNGARPGEEVVIQGGVGLDDKAKVKIIDTTVKEPDEDENEPTPPAGKDQKKDQKKDEAKPKSK
jgi:multidrug efflux pump subunit AcrA (membrane-fusion protein)